jgi:hypothetical protein
MIETRLLKLIGGFFQLLFYIAIAFLIGVIIYLGILYIITTPSEEKIKEVHKRLFLLVIAVFLIFLSFTIPKLIGMFFQIEIKLTP